MIFEYDDYKKWIQKEIDDRIAINSLYSGNSFAKHLGLSQSLLSQILNGKRKLTENSALSIANKLKLKNDETEYLLLMVKKINSTSSELKEFYESEIKKLKQKSNVSDLSLELFKVISEWQYSAILEALNLSNINHTAEAVSKKLFLSLALVKEKLEKLEELGLVEKNGRKYKRVNSGYLSTPQDIQSAGLKKFHTQVLKKAQNAIYQQKVEERHISGITMAIDPAKLPEAKKRLQLFMEELMNFLEDGERTEVYQLSTLLFKLEENREENSLCTNIQ